VDHRPNQKLKIPLFASVRTDTKHQEKRPGGPGVWSQLLGPTFPLSASV